jgi:glycosyltransferase involved in cell wall biosynthesis
VATSAFFAMTTGKNQTKVLVIGHSLAAPENRIPFHTLSLPVVLCAPRTWRSPGTRTVLHTAPAANLEALPVSCMGSNTLFHYRGLGGLMARHRPTLVYLWEEPWSLAAWQLLRLQSRFPFSFLFFSAENKPKRLFPPFSWIAKRIYQSASGAVTPTPEIAEQLRRNGFHGHTHTLPLWVSPRPHLPLTNQMRFAFIGRLIPLKRVDMLIQALVFLPDVIFRIIGDGPEKKALQELASGLGVQDRVEFLGHIPNENLEAVLQEVRLVALITGENHRQAEQFGKSVLDAVLSGLPAIVSPTGHLTQWALEFETVTTANCESPKTLAQDIRNALLSPPSYQELQRAREKAQMVYGPSRASLRFDQLFSDTSH